VRIQREEGSALYGESRLLVGPVGGKQYRLFGIPTTTGQVGFFAIAASDDGGAGSTAWVLDRGLTWLTSWNLESDGNILLIAYGLLGDDVVGVQIEINNRTHDVAVGENGFLFETNKHKPEDVNGFYVFCRDGTSAVVLTKP
jgi:hypothetical protein